MPYWLHDSKLIYVTRSLSSVTRFFITIALFLGIIVGWRCVSYLMVSRKIATVRKKVIIAQCAQKSGEKNEKKLIALQQQKDILQKQYKNLYTCVPTYQSTLDELFSLSDKYKLLSKGADHVQTEIADDLALHTIEMSVRGTFLDLLSFYTTISKEMSHIGITACSFKQSKRRLITMKATMHVIGK